MKLSLLLTLFMLTGILSVSYAQLPDGSIAPDWTHTDIYGNTHHLYDLLDQGKMVVIEFSATWCGPCWNYMLTGALEDFWEEHGPNGTDEAQVFYIEADQNTGMADLLGQTPTSQGNWVAAIPFPIIDLQVGEYTDNEYQINYYPTLYAVCSDRKIYELGQVPASEWAEFIQSCSLEASVGSVEEAYCYGEGSATVESSGGVSPITYQWNTGASGPTLQNVGAGTYSCTVTEGNNRNVVLNNIIITGAAAPISLASSDIDPALCYQSSTGSISVLLEEGVPPYNYNWSNGAQTQNIFNLAAGNYTLNATDNNGCTFMQSFSVSEPPELQADYEAAPEYCEQENGSISLDIDGGVGGYQVSASAGTVFGYNIINIPAGTVTVTVEDGNGCIWEDNIDIDFEPAPTMYFTPNPVISCAQPMTTVTGFVQGGSSDYSFAWSTTNGNIVGPTNQATITVDQPGDYQLDIYDLVTGCPAEDQVAVASTVSLPEVEAGDDTPLNCELLQLDLQGVGNPEYIVNWTTPDGHIVSGGNTYNPTIDAPGTYYIEVTNPDNSCSNIDFVTVINELDPASAQFQYQTSSLTIICSDQSSGSNLGGWLWTFGDGNSSNDPNTVHTYATAGIYQVCLNVQNGCGVSEICQDVEVTFVGSVINVDATLQDVLCFGGTSGSIILQVNGGSGNYTYQWTGPGGVTYDTPILTNVVAGVYQLVISDDVGNLFIGEFTLNEPPAIVLAASTVVDNLCFGETNGSITIDITGGVGPYVYSFNGGPAQTENAIFNLPGGIIECWITDANGCTFFAGPYSIQEPEELQLIDIQVTDALGQQQDDGSISLEITGGTPPYLVNWSNGATGTSIQGLVPGEYTYLITDAHGCTLASASPVIVQGTVSAYDINWSEFISIVPNPSRGNVLVRWDGLEADRGLLSLITLDGRRMESRNLASGTGQWDLTSLGLTSGVYIILFEMDHQMVPFKLVVL